MKRRQICGILLCIAMLFVMAGCAASGKTPGRNETNCKLPSRQESFFLLECENSVLPFYKDLNCASFQFFRLISAQPLTQEDLALTLPDGISYEFSLTPLEQEPFPYAVFATYQGQNWAELYQLYLESLKDNSKKEKYLTAEGEYWEAYSQLSEKEVLPLYTYTLTLSFPPAQLNQEKEIGSITISVKGQQKTYPMEQWKFGMAPPAGKQSGLLSSDTMALSDLRANPTSNGQVSVPPITYQASEDLEITKIQFLGDSASVLSANISSESTGVNLQWDDEAPFGVEAGDSVTLQVTAQVPNFANTLRGSARLYLEVQYRSGGEVFSYYVELTYRMRQNPYEIYAAEVDQIDLMPYYLDYANFTLLSSPEA